MGLYGSGREGGLHSTVATGELVSGGIDDRDFA